MKRLKHFSYFEPASVKEAVETLTEEDGAFPLAGGTDLLVRMKRGEIHPAALVNLKHIRNLKKIKSESGNGTMIGALASISDIQGSPAIRAKHPLLVQAAGLVDTLKGDGPFTVFAPTDEAFAKLPAGTVETLLKPENKDQLVAVLTYHVVPGKVMSGDIAGKKLQAATVQGQKVSVDATNGVKIDNATVVSADIETSNGVIHVIDTVILPKS